MVKESKAPLSPERILVTDEFISNNKLSLTSSFECAVRFEKERQSDIFGFACEVLIDYISFEDAKPHLKEDYIQKVETKEEKWEVISDINEAAQDFLDYMNFAWGKAEDERGISASRSIIKLGMWLWIMNREDLCGIINDDDLYNPYGAPALIEVCNAMGIKVPESLIEFSNHKC